MEIFFLCHIFFQNSISNLALNFYQRINKISEMNTMPIRASKMNSKRSIDIGGQFWVKKNESGHTNLSFQVKPIFQG